MRQKKRTKAEPKEGMLTIYPAPLTTAELNKKFVQGMPKERDGANSHLEAFLALMDTCLSLYPKSFSLYEAGILNYQGIPSMELERLFTEYVKKLCEWQVCDEIIGARRARVTRSDDCFGVECRSVSELPKRDFPS